MHDSIFKVNMVIYVYEKALAASFLLYSWPGFDQLVTDTPLGEW